MSNFYSIYGIAYRIKITDDMYMQSVLISSSVTFILAEFLFIYYFLISCYIRKLFFFVVSFNLKLFCKPENGLIKFATLLL